MPDLTPTAGSYGQNPARICRCRSPAAGAPTPVVTFATPPRYPTRTMRFGIQARAQQARFRDTLSASARTPDDDTGRRHGHLVALGHEQENLFPGLRGPGGALDVFRERKISWWRSGRSGDAPGDGPTRNLASSQVACVNFLLPLAANPALLLAFVHQIDPDVLDLVPIPDPSGAPAGLVQFEWVGWSAPIEGGRLNRGAMQTSADALIVGRTAAGLRALVFEWKYCEEYLRPEDKGAGPSGETRRRRFAGRYLARDSAFVGSVPIDDFLYEPFYQLLRLRLLADELQRSGVAPGLAVVDARVVVVCPAANVDYARAVASTPLARRFPGLCTVGELMCATLRAPDGIALAASERIVAGLRASPSAPAISDWLDYHRVRYGW